MTQETVRRVCNNPQMGWGLIIYPALCDLQNKPQPLERHHRYLQLHVTNIISSISSLCLTSLQYLELSLLKYRHNLDSEVDLDRVKHHSNFLEIKSKHHNYELLFYAFINAIIQAVTEKK